MTEQPKQQHDVAAEVRAVLARKQIRQRGLGEALGLNQPATSRRLSGSLEWTVTEIQAVAKFLDVPVASLFGETPASLEEVSA